MFNLLCTHKEREKVRPILSNHPTNHLPICWKSKSTCPLHPWPPRNLKWRFSANDFMARNRILVGGSGPAHASNYQQSLWCGLGGRKWGRAKHERGCQPIVVTGIDQHCSSCYFYNLMSLPCQLESIVMTDFSCGYKDERSQDSKNICMHVQNLLNYTQFALGSS